MAEICSTFELIGGISARLHPTCWAIGKLSVMRKPCVMTTRRDLASTLISSLPRVARSSVPGTELENFCELRERQNKTWWFVSCSQNLSKWDYFLVIDVHAQTQCANNLHEILRIILNSWLERHMIKYWSKSDKSYYLKAVISLM